jgi:hypothetical protein
MRIRTIPKVQTMATPVAEIDLQGKIHAQRRPFGVEHRTNRRHNQITENQQHAGKYELFTSSTNPK